MIENLPRWIELLFLVTVVATIVFFHFSNGKTKAVTVTIVIWSFLQSVLAYQGFYQNTTAMPPRFALLLIPSTLFIVYGILPKQQNWVLKKRDSRISTFLHTVRLPVEIVLFGLFANKMIPELMTFEGRNFDIIMGITAPVIGLLLINRKLNTKVLFVWNIVGLLLVSFILFNGLLSAEVPFQQFAFDQPNRAVAYFPFVLLPATVVPIVIWTHISDIIKLSKQSV